MKKKGLIISTVVMVVVLIAALTTTTFAWFSTTASARVDNLNVQTKSATGLEMVVFKPDDTTNMESGTYYSGDLTWSNGWTGDQATWGSNVAFNLDGTQFMGASGTGLSKEMFKLDSDESGVDSTGKVKDTTKAVAATANADYFQAYIALSNTTEEEKTIVITSMTVTATAAPDKELTKGMAASLRVAIYASATKPTSTVDFTSSDLKVAFFPFGDMSYTKSKWEQGSSVSSDTTKYLTGIGDGVYSAAPKSSAGLSKFVLGAGKAETAPDTCSAPANTALLGEATDADGVLYIMIAVWFEGEDPECRNDFAGGGATINIEFGFAA